MKSGGNLEAVLKAGHFAITGELGPPRGTNVEAVKKKAEPLKGMVDAVNITDNQTAVVRMSSWATSLLVMQEGLEPNYQMVCRDRNRLAMQADILGACAHGIPNMLCLSGDHQQFGDHPKSKGVFDIALGLDPELPKPPLMVPLGRILAEEGSAAAVAHYRKHQEQYDASFDVGPNYWYNAAWMVIEAKQAAVALPMASTR